MGLANRRPNRLGVDALDLQPGDRVLDLGCGPGDALALILPQVGNGMVYGLDQSAMMLRQASRKNRAAVRAGRLILCEGVFEKLPFEVGMFDRILASNVMYFWHDAPKVLAELRRVLRPGGRIVIYVTSADAMNHWKIAGSPTHRLFDAEGMRAALLEGGLGTSQISILPVTLPGAVPGLLAMVTPD
nr:methyltransferase domain-containing protein [Aquisediminimonas sediminicola]